MDKVLRPEHLETDPDSGKASKEWLHWKQTFDNFLAVLPQRDLDKLSVLENYVSPSIFQHIEDCTDYEAAWEYYKHFLRNLEMKSLPAISLPRGANSLMKRWMNSFKL